MVYSLDLDITPGGVPQIVKLSQYDKTMPQLAINLYNGSQSFTIPTGCTAYIEGTKADKTGFQYTCTISSNVISADITEQMTAFAGRVACEVVLRKSGERKGSANFFLDIEPAALSDDTIVSDSDLPILQQIPEILADCENYADLAHKWATFGNDSETPSSTNNALYWAQKSQEYAVGALHWKNSIPFANIPTTGMTVGDMYNITDAFTTDARFDEGAGVKCSAGTNIVWDANSKWDILISSTNAADINFDNTGTDLTATNVQNAITEINTSLSDKQPKTMSQTIAGETTVEGCLSTLNSNLSNKCKKPIWNKRTVSATTYTPTQDCFVSIYARGSADLYTEVSINNNTMYTTFLHSDGATASMTPFFYIPAGVTISYTTSMGTLYEGYFVITDTV